MVIISVFALYEPHSGLIIIATFLATVIVIALAVIVRSVPERSKEGLAILLPYALLFLAIGHFQYGVAFIIYLASAFGFAMHSFQFSHRAIYISGMISTFLTGLLLTCVGTFLVINSGYIDDRNLPVFWVSHVVFVGGWLLAIYLLTVRRRRQAIPKERPGTQQDHRQPG